MSTSWTVLVILLWAVVLILMVMVLGLARRVEALQDESRPSLEANRFVEPAAGARLDLSDAERTALGLRESELGAKKLLLFSHAGCPACRTLAREVYDSRGADGTHLLSSDDVVLVTDPDGAEAFAELAAKPAVIKDFDALRKRLDIPGTPYAIAYDAQEGVLGASFVPSLQRLHEFAFRAGVGETTAA